MVESRKGQSMAEPERLNRRGRDLSKDADSEVSRRMSFFEPALPSGTALALLPAAPLGHGRADLPRASFDWIWLAAQLKA